MIELRTLGGVELRGADGGELGAVLARPKRLALLAYLALSSPRGFQRRDALLALFWPEIDEEHARASLRKAVHVLRQALGPGVVVGRGDEELGLASEAIWCDVVAFEAALKEGRPAEAMELYRGELLPGFFVADAAPELGQWLDAERARLRGKAADAAWALARQEERERNLTQATWWARRAHGLAPDDERALRRLVTLLDQAGDRAGALDAYEAFAGRLRAEYEVEPSPETQRLVAAVRARTVAGPQSAEIVAREAAMPPAPSPAASPPASPLAASAARSPATVHAAVLGDPPGETVRGMVGATTAASAVTSTPSMPTLSGLSPSVARSFAGRYAIEREVARRGAMATVYVARDLRHGRRVAVKVLRPELSAGVGRKRFLREISVAARLSHPHILTLHDSGEAGGLLYYVMPYIEGETLRDRLDREGELPVEDALTIARQVAGALDYAHHHGVIHRDVKPENILLHAGEVMVADFGVAHAVRVAAGTGASDGTGDETGDRLTATGFTVGTPGYMSPEQASGDRAVDGRADVYALGCVLYEMLTGGPPFTGPTPHAVLARHAVDPVPSVRVVRPEVPVAIEVALFRALAKAPGERFATAQDFAAAVQGAARPAGAGPGEASLAERARPTVRSVAEPEGRQVSTAVRRAWPLSRLGDRGGRRVAILAVILAVAGAIAYAIMTLRKPVTATTAAATRWILVADFEHPPGDRTLGLAVRELVSATLEESKAFAMVPRDQLQSARRAAQLPDTALLTGERARHIAYRSAVRTIVEGRVDRLGRGRYSVLVHAIGVEDGKSLATATGAATEATMIPTVQRLASRIGSELDTRHDSLAIRVTGDDGITPSFDAYRRWAEAVEWNDRGDYGRAAQLNREAVRLDPGFSAAWLSLGEAYTSLERGDSTRMALLEARRFAERLTPADRHRLDARLADLVGDIESAVRSYDRLLEESPSNARAYGARGILLRRLGRYDEAVESLRRAVQSAPVEPLPVYVSGLVNTLAPLGRLDEARGVNERLHGTLKQANAMIIAASAADWPAAETLATALEGEPTLSTLRRRLAALVVASVQASRGQVAAAEQSIRRAAALDGEGTPDCCTSYTPELGQMLLSIASEQPTSRRPTGYVRDTTLPGLIVRGLSSAFAGDTTRAWRDLLAARAHPLAGADQVRQDVPLLEASIAARGGRWHDVVRLLGSAAWRGIPGEIDGTLNIRRWLVADAYERLGQPDSAAAYFQLFTRATRSGWGDIGSNGLAFPFAHRRLALLYTQLRRPADAQRHWEIFLQTFTDPDPKFRPMVEEARQRLTLLNSEVSATCADCAAGVAGATPRRAPSGLDGGDGPVRPR
jgi:serine/threonine-protein kinase